MPVLQIVVYGDPVLTRKAEPIKNINEEIVELAQNMVKTMHSVPGIGLSAPQVKTSKRLITVDLSVGEKSEDLIILVNPEFVSQEGIVTSEEGCLSVPGIQEKVTRSAKVVVKGIDLEGKEKVIEAEDLLARVLSHEIDHLNGKLFIDHLSPLKRSLIKKKLKRQLEEKKS
ncbi:MAG: peptide deformylase [Candidatus Aminicenantes bacterium]|nr:peptide deformylase [Candidatus Aminicenantes bacterium]